MDAALAFYAALPLARMEELARSLSRCLAPGDVVALEGEMGAGKTAFARALIRAIAPDAPEVTSPTFTLMQPYDVRLASGRDETLWHLDLYRLEEAGEADALGLEELWSHVTLIEWPGILGSRLPASRLCVTIAFAENARNVAFYGNDAWRERLKLLGQKHADSLRNH